jgi:hypothetical protein
MSKKSKKICNICASDQGMLENSELSIENDEDVIGVYGSEDLCSFGFIVWKPNVLLF